MDPSIMKLLEEDEDESMHSGADVEAFTAALNRDIESGTLSTQPSQAKTILSSVEAAAAFSQENNQSSGQMYSQWQPSKQTDYSANQSQQSNKQFVEQLSSKVDAKEHYPRIETKQEVNSTQEVKSTQEPSRFHMQYKSMQGDGLGYEVAQNLAQYSRPLASTQIPEQHRVHNLGSGSQLSNMQRLGNNQPVPVPEQVGASTQGQNYISFGRLLPIILPKLNKDRAMQLQTLYNKLRMNQIPKEGFVRQMKTVVGDQMLKLALVKMQAKSQNPSQQQQQRQRPPPYNAAQLADPYSFRQLAGGQSCGPVVSMQPDKGSGCRPVDNHSFNSREMQHIIGSDGLQANQLPDRSTISVQGLSKQQQEHLHFSQGSFPKYGGQPFSEANVNSPSTMARQVQDPQIRHSQLHQGFGSAPGGGTGQVMCNNVPKVEMQNSNNDTKSVTGPTMLNMSAVAMQHSSVPRQGMTSKEQKLSALPPKDYAEQEPSEQAHDKQPKASFVQSQGPGFLTTVQVEKGKVPGSSNDELSERQNYDMAFPSSVRTTNMTTSSSSTQMDIDTQVGSQSAGISKTSTKKPISHQKQPIDALASSPPLPSKKQKVSGAFVDQSIEHLNDVTVASGVNLREEEEQLFTLPKDDNRVLEASCKIVQEEEDRLILQKRPLQKKLAEIMTKFGLKNLSNDVERCLSLCIEERMRALISSLIRVSKQRADSEKSKHSAVVTSDVRKQILAINQKAREEWEKKQAEADKLTKQNQPDSSAAVDVDKEKDDACNKSLKVNKEQDDKMRTTAANVAARAAVGGDDMLSKWQLMVEARQKQDGGFETASSTQVARESNLKRPLSTFTGNVNNAREVGRKDQPTALARPGATRQACKHQARKPPPSVAPNISLKDVIAVLEREPQMARSALVYRLYDRLHDT
ncbi:hypothetical protein vseg_016046 [Gypsophila vaccaria]